MTTSLSAVGLGRRYGKRWALRDCTIEIPTGRVVALVGPNGAGKTTLLHLASGLLEPTEGAVTVLGGDPARDAALLARVGLVAQDMPLYDTFSVRDMLRAGRALNRRWHEEEARERFDELSIPLEQKVGTLSGGQRAQVALAMALAKRPELLLLDEPLASLDPLARRELMQTLMRTAADGDITIVLSSHLIADLERVCDHLVLVSGGRVQIADSIDSLLATHRVVSGPVPTGPVAGVGAVIDHQSNGPQATMTVRTDGPIHDPRWVVETIGLEELVLAYLSRSSTPSPPGRQRALDAAGAAS
jgi:ABC-2 type transport system ATP-binding protein